MTKTLFVVFASVLVLGFTACNNDDDDMPAPPTQSIVDAAVATPDLSILVSVLSKPGLSDILAAASNDNAKLTVFAPTNAAFQGVLTALGLSSIDEIPEEVLLDIVKYHIVGSVAKALTYNQNSMKLSMESQ